MAAAAAIALVSSAVALVGVWRNRAGAPDAGIELTEREASLGWVEDEDSGLSLRLEWMEPRRDWDEAGWFGQERLEAAGFDCTLPLDAPGAEIRYRKRLSREGYVVLEYEGPAWSEWLAHEERHTRLFLIDAGEDPEQLRRAHPDRERTLVVHALLSLDFIRPWDEKTRAHLPPFLRGRVDELLIGSIHVPRALRVPLDQARARAGLKGIRERGPLYAVRLTYGSRREPWLQAARLLEPPTR
jgi:hypothetical protein